MSAEQFTKLQVRNILNQARPRRRKTPKGRGLLILIVLCLIGTTLPSPAVSFFFSIAFIVLLTYSLSTKRLQWSYARTTSIAALVAMSILSGCGPLLSSPPEELLAFCSDKVGLCNTGTSTSWAVCGIKLNDISIEAAKAEGKLEQVVGVRHADGFGLIAVKQITVYGG